MACTYLFSALEPNSYLKMKWYPLTSIFTKVCYLRDFSSTCFVPSAFLRSGRPWNFQIPYHSEVLWLIWQLLYPTMWTFWPFPREQKICILKHILSRSILWNDIHDEPDCFSHCLLDSIQKTKFWAPAFLYSLNGIWKNSAVHISCRNKLCMGLWDCNSSSVSHLE